MGADGPLRIVNNIGGAWDGAQLTIHLKNHFFSTFLLSNLLSGFGPWHTQHSVLAVSYLAGQQYDREDHCEQESDVQFAGVHSSWSCEAVDMGLAFDSWTSKVSSARPGSVMDVGSLLIALANPLHLPFRHIEDVCNFSRRLGLEVSVLILLTC